MTNYFCYSGPNACNSITIPPTTSIVNGVNIRLLIVNTTDILELLSEPELTALAKVTITSKKNDVKMVNNILK